MVRTGVATLTGADGSRKTIHLTEKGRDLAREALRRSESGYSQRYDPGNHRDR
jgi:DNA-binding MarR family transcriptional regulator